MKDVTNTIRRADQADGAEIVAIDDIARGGDHLRRAPREGSPKTKNLRNGAFARGSARWPLWTGARCSHRNGGGRPSSPQRRPRVQQNPRSSNTAVVGDHDALQALAQRWFEEGMSPCLQLGALH